MSETLKVWVPVYKCERCGAEIMADTPKYNDYGASCFPNVKAPESISHRCARSRIGVARLVGLNVVPRKDWRMSDTPRMDEAADYTAPEKLHSLCKDLERELAAVTAERDALLNAVREIKNACKEGSLLAIASIGTVLEKKVRL